MAEEAKGGDGSMRTILWVMFGLFLINSTGATVGSLVGTDNSGTTNTAAVGMTGVGSTPASWYIYSQNNPNFTLRYHPDFEVVAHQRTVDNGFITFTNYKVYQTPASGEMNPTIELAYSRTTKPIQEWLREFHHDQTIIVTSGPVGTYQYNVGLQKRNGFAFKRGAYNYYFETITAVDTMRAMAESIRFGAS